MRDLEVGDLVRANCPVDGKESTEGQLAVVKAFGQGGDTIGLEFFKNVGGHSLDNAPGGPLAKEGHGWWANEEEIDLINLKENQ